MSTDKKYKAHKLNVYHGEYSDIVEYEYRGKVYEVEYSTCWKYCCPSAAVQHRDEQEKIDKAIERGENDTDHSDYVPFDEQMSEVFKMFDL